MDGLNRNNYIMIKELPNELVYQILAVNYGARITVPSSMG